MADKFDEALVGEIAKVIGVQPAFGILMKAYEDLTADQKKAAQSEFLALMSALKKLDSRQK